jgi:hypothetical protein
MNRTPFFSLSTLVLATVLQLTARTGDQPSKPGLPEALRQRLAAAVEDPSLRKEVFVEAVTAGAGFMPWQEPGVSEEETAFRREIEARKDRLLAHARSVTHPALLSAEQIARAKRNVATTDSGREWLKGKKSVADYLVARDDEWIERMIPELTPGNTYGFTCPNCVGRKSQEGCGPRIVKWNYRDPDIVRCKNCNQVYPHPDYPETLTLQAPRTGQTFTYFQNDAERAAPHDRGGKLAYHWVGRPMHVNFSGTVRHAKVAFMISAAGSLARTYLLTGEPRYAETTVRILRRLAVCYRNWLYHDYWDSVADCDPIYAAWHDKNLKLEWKRHLAADQYHRDSLDRASMLQSYWGAGRVSPSTDSVSSVTGLCLAYDVTYDATDAGGNRLWSEEDRTLVARDLILEWLMGAEPFLGGEGKSDCVNNKAPRIYQSMAAAARVLGTPELAQVALGGYEGVRDLSFLSDGFSKESPAYTNMYLGATLNVPDTLHGFTWPDGFEGRSGTVDLFRSDARLRLMLRAVVDQLRPDGRYPPLSDTIVRARPSARIAEIGLNRYPEYYRGKMPTIRAGGRPTDYTIFNVDPAEIDLSTEFQPPEILFPIWMTAILRHGSGPEASMLTLAANPPGGHRHKDNLGVFYLDRGEAVLGDHGYLGDMPQNGWIKSAKSHNLVVVDDADQSPTSRITKLQMMFTTPEASAVEFSSTAYSACAEYRRLVTMIKGPGAETFLVDIFRVTGGKKHAFRVFSEIGASDSPSGGVDLAGVKLPPEPELPDFAGSIRQEHIYGLRDVRIAEAPSPGWTATWKEVDRNYRLSMLSGVNRVEASNGPGQGTFGQLGRRVRYVDAVNEGQDVTSTFVALHEPSGPDGTFPVAEAELLELPPHAGPGAVAVKIRSKWGTYLVLADVDSEITVDGITFDGKYGLCKAGLDGRQTLVSCGARTLGKGDFGFRRQPARWSGEIGQHTDDQFVAGVPMPDGFPAAIPQMCQNYVLVDWGEYVTGYAVGALTKDRINVLRFPLENPRRFDLPALRVLRQQ